ncbi:MAG TPA: biotin carboxylase N-terminal domain-containing protein [Planctomycetota bacterium]|nr:biotin carboxylase N-terminal domain-containing protein [Planctomycetota bacterium]
MKRPAAPAAIRSLFIANRGEIALRIARTARRLGVRVCAAFSSADGGLPHLRLSDWACELEGDPRGVYLDIAKIIDAAKRARADAIHPGYGFLSENEDFAEAVENAGMRFVGPTADQIAALGDKISAREAAAKAGVPIVPGQGHAVQSLDDARAVASATGYPLLIKAAGGGGGRGMRIVREEALLGEALQRASSEAQAAFDDSRVFIEKYIERARHVEIQILGDGLGRAIALGERECSVQRRHQKLIEESPAPALSRVAAHRMGELAARLAAKLNYRGAGTMEFLVPAGTNDFYFIETNTRLQVEHPVTEMRTGLDLVEEQLIVAEGRGFSPRILNLIGAKNAAANFSHFNGHAIEARVIAEDASQDFRPSCGKLAMVAWPAGPGIRVDAWAESGLEVSPFYDSLLGKVISWGQDREQARTRLESALRETLIHPVASTAPFLARVIAGDAFKSGEYDTSLISSPLSSSMEQVRGAGAERPALAALAASELLTHRERVGAAEYAARPLSSWQKAE